MTEPDPRNWIGNTVQHHDSLATTLTDRIAATLGAPRPAAGDALPPLWHWAFFQATVDADALGADGHPARGGFLPPASDRNRMWAGGRLRFHQPLRVGEDAVCESEIGNVVEKQGRTGALLFVTVKHRILQAGELAIAEEQDIVYREPSAPKLSLDKAVPDADWRQTITPDPTLLFRYSAVTFNAHRIHYDWPYVTDTEGYPGLVVHGPLIATLLLDAFTQANPRARIDTFAFRGLRPLVAPKPFDACGRIESAGNAALWAGNDDGPAHEAELTFSEEPE
ncbi:FAS1-like dehydratase domain-containing protein [Salinisphaera aquimarina]|uniref:MaoC family dehydratase N-terminal domain-containing protein n=1 Tax=Salinisphaera aquimarina TaxID=2094031 RepID=A0ABV7ELP3_9GAMM